MKIDEFYPSDLLNATRKEFMNFVGWYNGTVGHEPLIVGGWAVYIYVPEGRGSRDIDVIFPGASTMDVTLRQYFRIHGYEERTIDLFGGRQFVKTLVTDKGNRVELNIDATLADTVVTDRNTGIRLDWSLAQKNCTRKEIDAGIFVYVPITELLVVYKLGALIKREKAMAVAADTGYYLSKILKDVHDVVQLYTKYEFDTSLLYRFAKEMKMEKLLIEINGLVERYAASAGVQDKLENFRREYPKLVDLAAKRK